MRANASDLLRNFPSIQRAALAGERVVIETREGNLVITAEKPESRSLFGCLASNIDSAALTEVSSGADPDDWTPAL